MRRLKLTISARQLLAIVFSFEAFLAVISYLVIVGLLLTDVFMREVFGNSIWGAQRISVYLMIITGFLGLGLATAKGRHLRPRFADSLIPKKYAGIADRMGTALMAIIFACFFVVSVKFVRQAYEYGDLARTIKFPLWTIQLVVPYAFASTALRYLIYALRPELKPEEELGE